jgi:hypothetical protein
MKMKSVSAALLIALTATPGVVVLATTALGQISVKEPPQPKAPPPKKADEGQYKSAIERLPDQKFDPWRNMR